MAKKLNFKGERLEIVHRDNTGRVIHRVTGKPGKVLTDYISKFGSFEDSIRRLGGHIDKKSKKVKNWFK